MTAGEVQSGRRLGCVGDDYTGGTDVASALRRQGLRTLLLANHGPIVAAADLATATDAIEELEETARLFLLLHGHPTRPLTGDQAERLRARAKA